MSKLDTLAKAIKEKAAGTYTYGRTLTIEVGTEWVLVKRGLVVLMKIDPEGDIWVSAMGPKGANGIDIPLELVRRITGLKLPVIERTEKAVSRPPFSGILLPDSLQPTPEHLKYCAHAVKLKPIEGGGYLGLYYYTIDPKMGKAE